MAEPARVNSSRATTSPDRPSPAMLCTVAWLVPGGGHFMLGQNRKALVFFFVLTFMYVIGLIFGGRIFPIGTTEPLVFLAGLSEWAIGLPRVAAAIGGFGRGLVTASTYEYGNTFLIVGGLLNALVMLDTYDVATGRKPR
jgi:hypothetical protein